MADCFGPFTNTIKLISMDILTDQKSSKANISTVSLIFTVLSGKGDVLILNFEGQITSLMPNKLIRELRIHSLVFEIYECKTIFSEMDICSSGWDLPERRLKIGSIRFGSV
jgi:hypothetical protein